MNNRYLIKAVVTVLFFVLHGNATHAQDAPVLTKKQEKQLSRTTVKTHVMGLSSFYSYASFLYAAGIATIHTDNSEINNTRLRSFPDPDKEVSLRELFDEIARQTNSHWSYDETRSCWLFEKPLSFNIALAPGWKKEMRQGYVFVKPPTAPAGMDIYFAGSVDSAETPADARKRVAQKYAKPISPGISADSMKVVQLPNVEALFYQTYIAKSDIIWRQWAIAAYGKCYVIVSAIKQQDEPVIFPDVLQMVRSFSATGSK